MTYFTWKIRFILDKFIQEIIKCGSFKFKGCSNQRHGNEILRTITSTRPKDAHVTYSSLEPSLVKEASTYCTMGVLIHWHKFIWGCKQNLLTDVWGGGLCYGRCENTCFLDIQDQTPDCMCETMTNGTTCAMTFIIYICFSYLQWPVAFMSSFFNLLQTCHVENQLKIFYSTTGLSEVTLNFSMWNNQRYCAGNVHVICTHVP